MRCLAFVLALLTVPPALAADALAPPKVNPELLKAFSLRALGPALTPGRISDIAVHPTDKATWYIVASSGGVWKTTNAGVSFTSIFDNQGSFSIGCIALDPKNPDTVWVGSGENQSQRSVGFGDGLYKSLDGGKTWKNVGLKKSEHLAKILIHPKDSDTVIVASQGPLWADHGDRGLFKTTDGGKTWANMLNISEQTGITDVVMDPRNPDVLFAASYQRRRNVGVLVGGGPESGIHKSTDGGKTWTRLKGHGLPETDLGRIALALSQQKPDTVYALFNTKDPKSTGFYRSENGGQDWKFTSEFRALDWQYMGRLIPDPNTHDTVWIPDLNMAVTRDGGKTIQRTNWPVHSDHHALWIDPANPRHMLNGNDGGLYETFDGGTSFRHFQNMSTTQFYRVGLDDAKPFYRVYGGTQDNGTMGGPHRSRNRVGVLTSEWEAVGGGDGFQPRPVPGNPDVVFTLSQGGALARMDRKTGGSAFIRPRSDNTVRWGWDTALIVSHHDPKRVYVAGSRLYKSNDLGANWTAISEDLTRNLDPFKVPVMGKMWGKDVVGRNTYTTPLSIITALSESPKKAGLLYVGTDDGLIQITEDDGKTWRKAEEFAGVPVDSYCSDVYASPHDENTVFATFNNWQRGDFKPYIVKSTDSGKTWRTIRGDFPARQPVWCIHQDAVNPDLLFAGTEFGLFVCVEGGGIWHQLNNGLPTIAVRDFDVHPREHDLVLATFGRGFYSLDDITPLRHLSEKKLADSRVFPVRKTYVYAEQPFARSSGNFAAQNPPFGVTATVYLKEKTTNAKLKIADANGKAVAEVTVPSAAGLHRVTWNLRLSTTGGGGGGGRQSILATPGKYTLTLTKPGEGKDVVTVGEPQVVELVPLGG